MKGTSKEKIERAKKHIKSLRKRKRRLSETPLKSTDAEAILDDQIGMWLRFARNEKRRARERGEEI